MKKAKADFEKELLDLTLSMGLSVRFYGKDGEVAIYEHLGEWECAEQALLAIKKMMKEQE